MLLARVTRGVALAFSLAWASANATSAGSPGDELTGLWKAQRWFGPHARGPLLVQKIGTTYAADMVGKTLPVRDADGELSFELPNGQGAFRGRLDAGGAILGHWFPPTSSALRVGVRYASPVRLRPAGTNRWSGNVEPFEDVFTFYLQARRRADGSLGAVLRNPERVRVGKTNALAPLRRADSADEYPPRSAIQLGGSHLQIGSRAPRSRPRALDRLSMADPRQASPVPAWS